MTKLAFHRISKLEVEEPHNGQAISIRLGEVQVIMPELELAVLFHPAQAQLMLERLVQPHFGMSLSDIVVDPSGEVFDIFRRPSPDEFALFVFFPSRCPARWQWRGVLPIWPH